VTSAASAQRDKDRLSELFLLHASRMGRLAYLLTGDRDTADDLVQDAFLKLARSFGQLRNVEAFESYFRRTVVNLARNHNRRGQIEHSYLRRSAALACPGWAEPAEPAVDHVADRVRLRDALLRLPPRSRAAIVLRYYEDLSELQVAELMRCRPGTVKSLVSHGMAQLREEIGDVWV
jgi:RNA polymerase sigma-70 factor (sigma-E family)